MLKKIGCMKFRGQYTKDYSYEGEWKDFVIRLHDSLNDDDAIYSVYEEHDVGVPSVNGIYTYEDPMEMFDWIECSWADSIDIQTGIRGCFADISIYKNHKVYLFTSLENLELTDLLKDEEDQPKSE